MKVTIGFVFAVITTTSALELPSNFKVCHKQPEPKYTKCLNEAVEVAASILVNGLKNLKILPIDPLQINRVKFGDQTSTKQSVSLEQEYRDIKITGISKGLKIDTELMDVDNKNMIIFNSNSPQIIIAGNYKINGKILVLPVYGQGKYNITFKETLAKHKIYIEKYEKNGEIYMRVTKYHINLRPKFVTLQYDNLFNGDPELGMQINKFINENSDIVLQEFQDSLGEVIAAAFMQIANKIVTRVPLNKLLPP